MKVYVSRVEEQFHDFIDEKNYYYFDYPRDVPAESFQEYVEARDRFKLAYQKVADHWESLRED